MSTIGFAGKAGWGRMTPADDVELAGAVRRLVWTAVGRTGLTGDSRDKLILAQVRSQYPTAVDSFGRSSILGLLRAPGPGRCSWCAARMLAAASNKALPGPTPALRRLLGSMCGSCEVAYDAQEVVERERAHVAAMVAAGLKPAATANLRTAEQIAEYKRRLAALDAAKLPPRPTGAIRPANRKARVPSYYQPRTRR